MAKKKEKEVGFAQKFLDKYKINDYASTLENSKLSNVTDWISSGSLSFNRVISGSYNKGFANNRLYVVAGPSSTGKSLIAGSTCRQAQKKGYTIAYFDSENAIDKDGMIRQGVDVSELIYVPIKTICDFRNEAIKLMRAWREDPDTKDQPLLIVLDSLGGLAGTKEMNDIEEGKSASDMGQRAKELRATARTLTIECGHHMIPVICTNHTYDQAAANPQAAPITKMSGGEGFMYAASAIVYLKKRAVNEKQENASGDNVTVKTANILIATSQKNRFVPEGTKGEIYVDFEKGISPFYGLLNDAIEFEFFEKRGPRIYVKHLDKTLFESQVYNKACFGPIMEELNKKVEGKYKFANLTSDDVDFSEDIAKEVGEKVEEIKDTK
jgi:RecA/RadA recombinase